VLKKNYTPPYQRVNPPDHFPPWRALPLNKRRKAGGEIHITHGYRRQKARVILLFRQEKVVDTVVVKTADTLRILVDGWRRAGLVPCFLPNPIKIKRGYWEDYRGDYGDPRARIELAKRYALLRDDAILNIEVIVLDIDSPYEEVLPAWEELRCKLGIERGYVLVRTKSGNFRAYIRIAPSVYEVKKRTVVDGKVVETTEIREFWLSAGGRGRNGKTHLQNAQELQAILLAFFAKRGLKADHTFLGRLNHPVWAEEWELDGGRSAVMEKKGGYAGKLYDLYRRAKKLQREEGLWTFGATNLTARFWRERGRALYKNKKKVIVPAFVVERLERELDDLYRWKLAVKKLAEKYSSYRFTRVMLPAVGWAKWLGLDRWEVEAYLRELLTDKKNFEKDLEKAYRQPALPFEWGGETAVLRKLLKEFLKRTKEGAFRQDLLREVFKGQNWLLQQVESFALREGLIKREKVKRGRGRGRKAYLYTLTEKGEAFLNSKPLDAKGGKKSIYTTPPVEEQRSGLVGAGSFSQKTAKEKGANNISDAPAPVPARASAEERRMTAKELTAEPTAEPRKDEGGGEPKPKRETAEVKEGEGRQEAQRKDGRKKNLTKLIEGRKLYAEAWVAFREVVEALEARGYTVVDTRYDEAERGEIDGRKLLRLVRLLVSTGGEVELDLSGWGRFAPVLEEVFWEVGLFSWRAKRAG